MKKINRKGFTLIELLAVIVILAVIMVVTIPSVLTAMSGAKVSQLNNASETVARWLTKNYELANLDLGLDTSSVDLAYTNFVNKMGTSTSTYSDASFSSKNLSSCGNSNATYCQEESIAMLEAAGVSDPENNIDLANSYVWFEENKFVTKLNAKEGGAFYTNGENSSSSFTSRLPDGYREVAYLQGNNTGYVPTNIYLTGDSTVRLKFETTSSVTACYIFGYYNSSTEGGNYSIYMSSSGTTGYIRYNNELVRAWKPSKNTKYEIVMSPTGLTINNSSIATWETPNQTFTCVQPMYIGLAYGKTAKLVGRIYEFKVDGVFDGVPAVRESDGKTGFYDLITNTFFPTTGTLTAGY